MGLTLSAAELAKVEQAKQGEVPSYYSATTLSMEQVSEDFVAFLALAPTATKAEAVNWIRNALLPLGYDPIRQALMDAAIQNEIEDLHEVRAQVNALISSFYDFQGKFPHEQRFALVPEVSMIREDAEIGIDFVTRLERRWKFQEAALEKASEDNVNGGISDERKRQALSWISLLTAPYGG